MSQDQIRQVEVDIKVAQANIRKMDTLDKLYGSPAFKEVIMKGYFEDETKRLVLLKAEPAMQKPEHQERIEKGIDAIGYLNQYFRTIFTIGGMSEKALSDDETTREELLAAEG